MYVCCIRTAVKQADAAEPGLIKSFLAFPVDSLQVTIKTNLLAELKFPVETSLCLFQCGAYDMIGKVTRLIASSFQSNRRLYYRMLRVREVTYDTQPRPGLLDPYVAIAGGGLCCCASTQARHHVCAVAVVYARM